MIITSPNPYNANIIDNRVIVTYMIGMVNLYVECFISLYAQIEPKDIFFVTFLYFRIS